MKSKNTFKTASESIGSLRISGTGILDVVFAEDAQSYRDRCGAQNMAVLRQLALNLLTQDDSSGSLKGKRKRAAWDDDFRKFRQQTSKPYFVKRKRWLSQALNSV